MNTSGKPADAGYVLQAPVRQRDAVDAIAHKWPFAASNMRGELESFRDPGDLPEPHRSAFCNATWREGETFYVIRSYETPIAWHAGSWEIPDVHYSTTTSRHQAVVRRAIEALDAVIDVSS